MSGTKDNSKREVLEDIIFVKSTKKALLIDIDDEEYWIPRSIIDFDSSMTTITADLDDVDEGDIISLDVAYWWADENNLV